MREAIIGMLAGWARLCHAEPLYTTLIGVTLALTMVAFSSALFRARLFAKERISGGPILIVSALVVFGLCLVWTAIDGLLAWAGAPLLSEHVIRALAPRVIELGPLGQELGLDATAGRDAVLRAIMGAPAGETGPLLPGGVSLALGLVLAGGLYYGIARLLAGTLSEMLALQRKPEDVLREERRRRLEARAKAKAEADGRAAGDAEDQDATDAAENPRQAGDPDEAGDADDPGKPDNPWKAAAAAWARAGDSAIDPVDMDDEVDPEKTDGPLPAPIPDDFWGRVYKLGGHFRSYRYVESRYLRWQKPLSLSFFGLLLLGAFPAAGGYMPVPVWVGAAIFAIAFHAPMPARDRQARKQDATKAKAEGQGAKANAARDKAMPAFAERAEVSVHLRAAPRQLMPAAPGKPADRSARASSVHATPVLEQITRAMDAHPMYSHQAAAAAAFDARASVLLCTAPGSGRRVTCDALSLYAVLADGERVLYLERDPAAVRIAHQRFEARAAASHWKWNVLSLNLADRAGTLDPSQAQPSLIFADARAVHRHLCGQHPRWQAFLAGLGTVIVPDLDRSAGVPAGHLAQLIIRLERLAGRARTAALGRALMHEHAGERTSSLRFVVSAHPGQENLARYVERVIGRSVTVIGPRQDSAPRPRHDFRVVATDWEPGGAHPALGVRELAHELGYRAALVGYDDILTDEERGAAGAADVIIARHAPASMAALPLDTMHLHARAGGPGRKPSIAVLVLSDPTPMARHLTERLAERAVAERTAAENRAPERGHEGPALIAWPNAPAIERAHVRATLAECELSVDELARRFSRESVAAELDELRAQGRLLEPRRRLLDPIAGEVRAVESVRLSGSEDVHAGLGLETTGEPWTLCERATGEVLFELEGERARAAAYPGRVLVARGRRFEVLMDHAQDQRAQRRILCEQLDTAVLSAPMRTLAVELIERRRAESPAADVVTDPGAELPGERRHGSLRSMGGARFVLEHRDVLVTETLFGVRRFDLRGRPLDESVYEQSIASRFRTRAAVLGLIADNLPDTDPDSADVLHALAHGIGQALPALIRYQPDHDLDITSMPRTETWPPPSLAFVDLHPGGAGFAEAIDLDILRRLCRHALDLMRACPDACERGCPACLHMWTCRAPAEHYQATDKQGAIAVLEALLGQSRRPMTGHRGDG